MLQKWKDIIANWINCYFNENEKREDRVTLESCVNIISHLRDNLSLDESTSSILEAHTVEEFLREKFADFRFNNGSVEASTEDEIYMVASLLLYFVCVNSKDMDLKHAMCSQLSREDQEVILKFSKCLMECTPVTFKDVQAAIIEACGQDTTNGPSTSRLVSETPPALRSLHGEVRRLQAALEAERFDRNYLQEELARTNLRLEKLAKDKEQYKLEIVNLKAKISLCCGQERDARAGDAASESSAKLMRDLEQMEERLVQTQGLLDDAQYERDTYKAKLNELKQERDKWLSVSQQEALRASELCTELESARQQAAALSELVAELRQHHKRNALDASALDCSQLDGEERDAAAEHDASICSEACANVIEVQLGEERAKIVVLKQQIDSLQDQLNDLTHKYETEKQSLQNVVSQRENEIFNLKHRINEEIEEKNNMTIHFSDAMSKLNNEINELEQKLKDNNQQSRMVVEMKMQEIQTLQEEKLSLLQSLTDETNKLESIIKTLKSELDAEKSSKAKMRDDYENHIMKLNEKVLNRNNELVELQNDVFEKSDKIEALYLELRKEKQARDELVAKHHDECERMHEKQVEYENTIKLKNEEIARMSERLTYNFEFIKELGREVDELKVAVSEQSEHCKFMEQTKLTILEELNQKENKLEELQKRLETVQNMQIEEKDKLGKDLDEATARIDTLQMQLHGELQFKIGLQDEYAKLEHSKMLLIKEIEQLKEEVTNLQTAVQHKDKTIEGMDLFLQEEKRINDKVKQECENLNMKIKTLCDDIALKDNEIKVTEDKLIEARKTFEEELRLKNENIELVNQKLLNVIEEKKVLQVQLDDTIKERNATSNELSSKVGEILQLQKKNNEIVQDSEKSSQALHLELNKEKDAKQDLIAKHQAEYTQMAEKLIESEKMINLKCDEIASLTTKLEKLDHEVDELKSVVTEKSENCKVLEDTKVSLLDELQTKNRQLEELNTHLEHMQDVHSEEKYKLEKQLSDTVDKVSALEMRLDGELQVKMGLQHDLTQLEHVQTSLSEEIKALKEEVNKLQNEIQHKDKTIERTDLCFQEEKRIKEKVQLECKELNENVRKLSEEIAVKNNAIKEIEKELAETKKMFEEDIHVKHDYIESVNQKLFGVVEEKAALEVKLNHTTEEKDAVSNELKKKVNEILQLQENVKDMNQIIIDNRKYSQELQLELTKEKQVRDELIAKHNDECVKMTEQLQQSENKVKLKCDEVVRLTERIKELDRALDELNNAVSAQSENCRVLQEMKVNHLKEILTKDNKLENLQQKLELMENLCTEDKDKFEKDLNVASATINALEIKLDRELKNKISLQDSYAQLDNVKSSLLKEVELLAEEVTKLQTEIQHKDKTIEGMDQFFEEEKLAHEKVKQECQNLNEKIQELTEDLKVKDNEIKAADKKLAKARKTFEKKLHVKQDDIDSVNEKLSNVMKEKENLENKLDQTTTERDNLSIELCGKVNEVLKLQKQNDEITKLIEDNNSCSQALNSELIKEKHAKDELLAKHHDEYKQLNKKLNKVENELKLKSDELARLLEEVKMKDAKLEELQKEMEIMVNEHSEERDNMQKDLEELASKYNALQIQLNSEIQSKNCLQDDKAKLENTKTILTKEIETLKEEINKLNIEMQYKEKSIDGLDLVLQEEKRINEKVRRECQNLNENIKQLSDKITVKDTEIKSLELELAEARKSYENELRMKRDYMESGNGKLTNLIEEKQALEIKLDDIIKKKDAISNELIEKAHEILRLQEKNKDMEKVIEYNTKHVEEMSNQTDELKIKMDSLQTEFLNKVDTITKEKEYQIELNKQLNNELHEKHQQNIELLKQEDVLSNQVKELSLANKNLELEKAELDKVVDSLKQEMNKVQKENVELKTVIEENRNTITELEKTIELQKEQSNESRLLNDNEKLNLNNKCALLQEYQMKSEKQMEGQQKDIAALQQVVESLKTTAELHEKEIKEKCDIIKEKDEQINNMNKYVAILNAEKEKNQAELETKITEVNLLKHKMNSGHHEEVQKALRSEEWVKAMGQRDMFAVAVSEKSPVYNTGPHKTSGQYEKEYREFHHQVDNTTSDLTHSSMESIKTISDLEKIITDKNRTITTLQCDITYLKSLIADSENKLLDVNKELEVSKENCQQLAGQLKKIVHQKNEEIAELKKQVNKMSVTETRASQIIKVSAKYQAIILKRIAEIKSNTVLKELTNFGNSTNGDNELRRSLNAGTVTMEDLENFLETTDKHLKRCSEKQIALQKERDRLVEVNRINESEIINLKKFLTELSVSFKTFSNVKDLYAQKFSRVVSVQRTVRREILSLDGHITDAVMCKLERGYAAVMQDLSECVMNMERWVERCIGRTISPEKIKQAFTNDEDRASFASTTFQNTGLEVQLDELENSFQKLLEEVVRAQKGEGARDAQSVTVMEVRAEYEDKLNRMKAKMKQLYQEQIAVYKEKQHSEVVALERELAKTREKLAESSKAYEEHIKALTAELWSVGEKFLTKKDEVDWLRKKQRSGSLMSLQHVHSSGLVPPPEEPSRPSDTHSLRSLPVHTNPNGNKRDKEGRGLHMSDEEGEVFDNRWLRELASTPRRAPAAPPRDSGMRLSELKWRNSLCPPHLKSSYPAETQFQPVVDEDDIKYSLGGNSTLGGRPARKEVGITAYKKPGPPTPSKNAGRLSATDSELRESLRVEAEPQPSRKTSTPSRLRALFRSGRNDTAEGTPRSRRLSIFRKK